MKKRKKGKIILAVAAGVLAVAVCGILFLWNSWTHTEGRTRYEAEIREQMDQMIDQWISEADQKMTGGEEPPDGTEASTGEAVEMGTASAAKSREARIRAAYDPVFGEMQQKMLGMLDSLIAQGKTEYWALVDADQHSVDNIGKLAADYMGRVESLEAQVDASFETVLGRMKRQLDDAGVDSGPIIEEYRDKYHRQKELNRGIYEAKARAAVGL